MKGLTHSRKEIIRAEEIYRNEVQKDLEKSNKSKFDWWALLNSSFVLWVLSSIILTVITGLFTHWSNENAQQLANESRIQRLDEEIDGRLYNARLQLKLSETKLQAGHFDTPHEIYTSICCYLNNTWYNKDNEGGLVKSEFDKSTYQEFKDEKFTTILAQLYEISDLTDQVRIRRAHDVYESLQY